MSPTDIVESCVWKAMALVWAPADRVLARLESARVLCAMGMLPECALWPTWREVFSLGLWGVLSRAPRGYLISPEHRPYAE